jgi:hypothetical protein
MSMPQSRRKAFVFDERALEIRMQFDDGEWTTWVFEENQRLVPIGSIEPETVQEAMSQGIDAIGDLMEAAMSDVLAGAVELPPRRVR